MDFTWIIAGLIALIVGFLAGWVFVLIRGQSKFRLIVSALLVSLGLNGYALINWDHVDDVTLDFLLLDFAVIAAYSLVGCIVGTLPAVTARYIWRKLRAYRATAVRS